MLYRPATIGAFVLGTGLGWTSPALPRIQDATEITHEVDDDEASWIGSLFAIGALVASQVCKILVISLVISNAP